MPRRPPNDSVPLQGQTVDNRGQGDAGQAAQELETSAINPNRRRLLKIGVYTSPAVAGTLLVSKEALAQEGSCIPYGGTCAPEGGPCLPGSPCRPEGAPCVPEWLTCGPDICLPTIFG